MEPWMVPVGLLLVLINVVLIFVDINFWKKFFSERGKRHKRVKTNR